MHTSTFWCPRGRPTVCSLITTRVTCFENKACLSGDDREEYLRLGVSQKIPSLWYPAAGGMTMTYFMTEDRVLS